MKNNKWFQFEACRVSPFRISVGRVRLQPGPSGVICLLTAVGLLIFASEWSRANLVWIVVLGVVGILNISVAYYRRRYSDEGENESRR